MKKELDIRSFLMGLLIASLAAILLFNSSKTEAQNQLPVARYQIVAVEKGVYILNVESGRTVFYQQDSCFRGCDGK
jgi:hypothetical protein